MDNSGLPIGQVLTGDCVQIMNELPECSIDLIFADPPYNLQLRGDLRRPNNTLVDAVDDSWDRFESFAEYDAFTRSWLGACRRVLKDTGTIWAIGTYHNIHRVGAILQELDYWILNDVAWVKLNPMPNFRGVRFTNAHETLIWAQKVRGARYTFNHHLMKELNDGLQMRSDWYLPLCTGKERVKVNGTKAHTAQKPEALLKRIILASTNPGEIVLDPFFGTGTTGAVAHKWGRKWIGIEKEAAYAEIARKRIASLPEPGNLEDMVVLPERRRDRRIPFSLLLDSGYLKPGQNLYSSSGRTAVILESGQIRCGDIVGSIHYVARILEDAPCNGWDYWRYLDEDHLAQPIDVLRKKIKENGIG